MIDKILHKLQKDICDEKGHYKTYIYVLCIFFLFDILFRPYKQIKLLLNISIFILSVIALLLLLLIYFKFKGSRIINENKIIMRNIIFFTLITLAFIWNIMRILN